MVKRVVDSATVAHMWANQTQDWARSQNVSFQGREIRSYAEPIGRIIDSRDGGKLVIINSHNYSVTTSKHQKMIRRATRHIEQISIQGDFGMICDIMRNRHGARVELLNWVLGKQKLRVEYTGKETRASSDSSKESWRRYTASLDSTVARVWYESTGEKPADVYQTAETALDGFNRDKAVKLYGDNLKAWQSMELTLPDDLAEWTLAQKLQAYQNVIYRHVPKDLSANFAFKDQSGKCEAERVMPRGFIAKYRKVIAAAKPALDQFNADMLAIETARNAEIEAINAERNRLAEIEKAAELESWLNGDSRYCPRIGRIVCRVMGDEVQTSEGARVPLDVALLMARKAAACRDAGKPYVANDAVGQYALRHITATGDLQIGCHFIPWQSIEQALNRYHAGKGV